MSGFITFIHLLIIISSSALSGAHEFGHSGPQTRPTTPSRQKDPIEAIRISETAVIFLTLPSLRFTNVKKKKENIHAVAVV